MNQKTGLAHCIPGTELSFEIALAEHYDLNCAGCNHFSPLAEPEFADYEEVARDFACLSSLFHGHAKRIHLLGGEPLLYPDLVRFLKLARQNFPDAAINIVTNGVRLLNQPEEFWTACKENNIVIQPTKYSIRLNFKEMEKCAADHGVQYQYYYNSGTVAKTVHLFRFDVKDKQDSSSMFLQCANANHCVYLQHGKLYTCSVAPTARHFNRYFGENLKESPEDSIDIYQAASSREIMDFLARPIPFADIACWIRQDGTNYGVNRSEKLKNGLELVNKSSSEYMR